MAFSVEYVAGLFDGEGCIHIGRRKRGIRLPQFFLQVSITMAHTMILELEEFTGGYTQTIMRDLHIPGRRRIHTISWTGTGARDFLESIYDHLHIKQEEARVAIIFQDHMNAYKGHASSNRITLRELQRLTAYREKLRLRVKECKDVMLHGAADWDASEFGEPPMPGHVDAEGQSRAKQEATQLPGVCREHVLATKVKMCSGLARNGKSAAEMTAPRKRLRLVE